MRGSAAVQVTIANFAVWRLGLALIGLVVTVVWALWLMQIGVSGARLVAAMAVVLGAAAWIGWSLLQVGPVAVRWEGGGWRVGPSGADPDLAPHGALHVYLDFGVWLLLRFVPDNASTRAAASWLPVQRQGSAKDWHALRCALYAPQPRPTPPSAEPNGTGA
jgi:hypothetical protein